jgi:hypothetical protein
MYGENPPALVIAGCFHFDLSESQLHIRHLATPS